ncbi:MAG TPA: deoxyribonuclease IV [Candidatus Angelobacter sp.]|jgi:deoxyribonuclease-4|nr:deoxyribonuclease IV [Candidatus Angelobacter sp.]
MKDVLLWSQGEVPKPGPRRIGIHTSTAGGVQAAAERAYRLGANTFQIFSSSPRQWKPYELGKAQCDEMRRLREKYGITPLAVHSSYLVNLASSTPEFHRKSVQAFRGELERALTLCAEFLVLHPGSFRGRSREDGLALVATSIAEAAQGLDLEKSNLRVLIENTAGSEFSLGGSFDQVAQLLEFLQPVCPVGACIDTCHTHVSGYDIVSESGWRETMLKLDETIGLNRVFVWHCNDAKDACGSRRDRHEHIGKGTIGLEPFRRLLNDPRTRHAAFIAETPIEEPRDDMRNIETLKSLVESSVHRKGRARHKGQDLPQRSQKEQRKA